MSRILSMNEHYIKTIDENELYNHLVAYCANYIRKKLNQKKKKRLNDHYCS